MFRLDKMRSPAERFPSLEKFPHMLEETYRMARDSEGSGPSWDEFKPLESYLSKQFAEHDRESFDCHSFVCAILRREFGISQIPSMRFDTPDRNAFEYESEWNQELLTRVEASPDFPDYHAMFFQLTEDIYDASDHIPLHKLVHEYDADGNETLDSKKRADTRIAATVQEVIERTTKTPASRVLLISNGRGEEFYDAHSSIILGPDQRKRDLLLLEKAEIGSPVKIERLSRVVENWGTHYDSFGELELNVCRKPIQLLFPAK